MIDKKKTFESLRMGDLVWVNIVDHRPYAGPAIIDSDYDSWGRRYFVKLLFDHSDLNLVYNIMYFDCLVELIERPCKVKRKGKRKERRFEKIKSWVGGQNKWL
jgi:hypothetical protein